LRTRELDSLLLEAKNLREDVLLSWKKEAVETHSFQYP
jgi:hypothetical protein